MWLEIVIIVLVVVTVVTLMFLEEEDSYRNTLVVFQVGEDYATVSVANYTFHIQNIPKYSYLITYDKLQGLLINSHSLPALTFEIFQLP